MSCQFKYMYKKNGTGITAVDVFHLQIAILLPEVLMASRTLEGGTSVAKDPDLNPRLP